LGLLPGVPEGPDHGQFLVECDRDGRITWMSESARARLGAPSNFLDRVPPSQRDQARRLLTARDPSEQPSLTCLFRRNGRQADVPVHFVRVLATGEKVVLAVEVKERASDERSSPAKNLELLLELQQKAVLNYFRLLQVQEILEGRQRPARAPAGELIAEALESERTRIARELHATAGQSLAGIKLNVEIIHSMLPEVPEGARNSLGRIQLLADQALNQIRSVSQRLHPPDWQLLGLAEAIEALWNTTGIPHRFRAKLDIQTIQDEPSHGVRVALYRSAQEGLSNVLRHSGATEVQLGLEQKGDRIYLTLEDNGRGFDVEQFFSATPQTVAHGIGVRSMLSQIRSLNGDFEIRSGPGGTRMEISLPLRED
jgi:signal transduction histidine kinase